MTDQQKQVCRYLLSESVRHGFGNGYSLEPIAKEMGVTVLELYDNNTNTGILWDLGPHGSGDIYVHHDGSFASVEYDMADILGHWCDFKGY
jgi:hypothetical protein